MTEIIPRAEPYFRRLAPGVDPLLEALEKDARQRGIPIVGPVVGQLLHILILAAGARSVLELGTATGYSAIWMGRACQLTGGHLTTFELEPYMAAAADINLQRAGLQKIVAVRRGNAVEHLRKLAGPYDMIFIDIEKEDYIHALPHCKALLRQRGVLVADNTAFAGAIDFNRSVFEDPAWCALNLLSFLPGHSPEKDGLCIALKV